jgi:hypothetical protein
MKPEIKRAIQEVLEAWETPDSPEAMVGAMYQLRRTYDTETSQIPSGSAAQRLVCRTVGLATGKGIS